MSSFISRFIYCNSTSKRQTSIIFGPDPKIVLFLGSKICSMYCTPYNWLFYRVRSIYRCSQMRESKYSCSKVTILQDTTLGSLQSYNIEINLFLFQYPTLKWQTSTVGKILLPPKIQKPYTRYDTVHRWMNTPRECCCCKRLIPIPHTHH